MPLHEIYLIIVGAVNGTGDFISIIITIVEYAYMCKQISSSMMLYTFPHLDRAAIASSFYQLMCNFVPPPICYYVVFANKLLVFSTMTH